APQLAGARRRELGLDVLLSRNPPAQVEELDARGLAPGADVEDTALVSGRRERRAHHVDRVDVVARLLPVAEDLRRLPARKAVEEDRDDACLAVWILARPVDVPVAQRDVPRAVQSRSEERRVGEGGGG